MTPGVRQVVIPSQHANLTIVIPTCDQAQTLKPGATTAPPGSNTVVIPKGAQTETVAVQPCQGGSSGGGSTPPPSSTILMTPGGAGTSQQSSGSQSSSSSSSSSSGSSQPNQLVLPNNASITTLIVPPCTQSSSNSQPNKGLALPGKGKSITAPPCTVPQQSSSS
jgi:hypothetical protein